jgi:hypothetical protein
LIELVRMLGLRGHGKFEKWCTLAAVGDLGVQQLNELELHVAKCAACRELLEDFTQASLQAMPVFWEKRKPSVGIIPPDGMRPRFLRRLREYRNGPERTLPAKEFGLQEGWAAKYGTQREERAYLDRRPRWPQLLLRPAIALVMAAALPVAGYYFGLKSRNAGAAPQQFKQPVAQTENAPGHRDPSGSSEQQTTLLASVWANLERERSIARDERTHLEERLAASSARLVSLEQADASELQRTLAEREETNRELELAKKENESLYRKFEQTEALLAAKEHQTQELQTELEVARSSVRDQDDVRLSPGQLGEMVTAKNLHIVDVYDADGGGNRKHSFGRVFYVEGKSLLFYAYDLQNERQARANVVFHVWGGRAGTKEVTHSLGLLHNENVKEGLWTLTFDDPSVLAKINSVFVTVESANRRDGMPHGKKVLYAYFGNPPNHP